MTRLNAVLSQKPPDLEGAGTPFQAGGTAPSAKKTPPGSNRVQAGEKTDFIAHRVQGTQVPNPSTAGGGHSLQIVGAMRGKAYCDVFHLMFARAGFKEHRNRVKALKRELLATRVWNAERTAPTTLLHKLWRCGLRLEELKRVIGVAAVVRHGLMEARADLDPKSMDHRVLEANWRHLKMELNLILDGAYKPEPSLTGEDLADAAIASLMSDADKLGDFVVNHDVHAVWAWNNMWQDHFSPSEPDHQRRILRISAAILEHQGVPPDFMAGAVAAQVDRIRVGELAKRGLSPKEGLEWEGTTLRPRHVDSLANKIANPYLLDGRGAYAHLTDVGDGRLVLKLKPAEKILLGWVRDADWHIPNPAHPEYAISWEVIDKDARANYLTGNGARKIFTYRGWKTGHSDKRAEHAFQSIVVDSFESWGKFFQREGQRDEALVERQRLIGHWETVKLNFAAPGGWLEKRRNEFEDRCRRGELDPELNPFTYHSDGRITVPYWDEDLTYPTCNLDPARSEEATVADKALTPRERARLEFHLEMSAELGRALDEGDAPPLPSEKAA